MAKKRDRTDYMKTWRAANKERLLAYQREYKATHKSIYKSSDLKYTYGITLQDFDDIFKAQKGCCLICGRHQSECKRALCVDHDHETGQIRGLLCVHCNSSLGWYERRKQQIINYLGEIK